MRKDLERSRRAFLRPKTRGARTKDRSKRKGHERVCDHQATGLTSVFLRAQTLSRTISPVLRRSSSPLRGRSYLDESRYEVSHTFHDIPARCANRLHTGVLREELLSESLADGCGRRRDGSAPCPECCAEHVGLSRVIVYDQARTAKERPYGLKGETGIPKLRKNVGKRKAEPPLCQSRSATGINIT